MVTVTGYALRESKDKRTFVSLQLEGDPEFVQSMQSGRFYLTAKRCNVTSTFSEQVAKLLVGKMMPGSIIKVECDPYDYAVPETGELITLAHTYEYVPEETKQVIVQRKELANA